MAKIYISPSNQEHNTGYGNYGTEQDRMFQVCNFLYTILKRCGNEVYISKKGMTFQEAAAESNKLKCDIHLPIHSNAFNTLVRGTVTMYVSDKGKILSDAIYAQLSAFTPTSDRGSKKVTNLYELNATNAVAAYTEIAFHDNKEDAALIVNNIEHIAELIAKGVCQYLKIPYVEKAIAKPTPTAPTPSVNLVLETQKFLNKLGITDYENKRLDEDGLSGKRTKSALEKLVNKL